MLTRRVAGAFLTMDGAVDASGDFDPTSIGLPAGFMLTDYTKLKG